MQVSKHVMKLLAGGGMLPSQIVVRLQQVVKLILQRLRLAPVLVHVGQ